MGCIEQTLPFNWGALLPYSSFLLLLLEQVLLEPTVEVPLVFLAKLEAITYHCSIEPGYYSNSMSF